MKDIACIILCAVRAKSLQSCLTLCDPINCSPPGFSVHGIFPSRILEWVTISFSNYSVYSCVYLGYFVIIKKFYSSISLYLLILEKSYFCTKKGLFQSHSLKRCRTFKNCIFVTSSGSSNGYNLREAWWATVPGVAKSWTGLSY